MTRHGGTAVSRSPRDIGASEDQRAQDFKNMAAAERARCRCAAQEVARRLTARAERSQRISAADYNFSPLAICRPHLTKVKPSLPAETQKKVDAVLAAIKPTYTVLGSKDTVDLRLAESIHAMADAITKAVPGPVKAEDKSKENAVF